MRCASWCCGAWFAAALFAVHPVTVESVAWLTERKSTLSMVLFLLSMLIFLRFEDRKDEEEKCSGVRRNAGASGPGDVPRVVPRFLRLTPYIGALCLFTMALLAKVAVTTMPLLLLLVAWWRRGRITRADMMRVVPFFIVAVLLGLVALFHEYEISIATDEPRPEGLWSRLAATGWCIWFYLFKLALPLRLSIIYPRGDVDPASAVSWLPLAGLVALPIAACWRRSAWGRPVLAALGAYAAMRLPVLGLVDIGYFTHSLVADRFQYFACGVPVCLAVGAVCRLAGLLPPSPARSVWGIVAAVGVLAVLSALTWHRCGLCATPAVLWHDTVRKNRASLAAHYNLGVALASQGHLDDAVACYRRALLINPRFAPAHHNLGLALKLQGRIDEAIASYRRSLLINPRFELAHKNMGVVLQSQGRIDEAIAHHRVAIEIDPYFASAHSDLGIALASQGSLDEAVAHFRRAVRLKPADPELRYNLGQAFGLQGQLEKAIHQFHEALRINPDLAAARTRLNLFLEMRNEAKR